MYFIYVMSEEDHDKMVKLGYKEAKENVTNNIWLFYSKGTDDGMFSTDEDNALSQAGVSYVLSNVMIF